ncbi:haloacid dehalogenase type II [Paracoccus subflavus]|uniref:(S)-2-haloacid dehalogenase n=1 Tax=Paracoccus subflavus TaxID=2528244 RepID=A0A4Q9G1B9_9RHOB|nr:haloacid dehalogenase type II [Paracoccus subflavus]TBN41084.1 haloacid dehalogenase type II [Paracoccus subflavus]
MDRAFIFDVFGTLVDWRQGIADAAREAFGCRGLSVDPYAFADHWRACYDPAMERVRSGSRGYVPLDLLHRENLDQTLTAMGIADAFDEAARNALNRAWECLPPWPDVHQGMDRLRPFGLLAPCSNASIALSARLARFAGLRWDAVLGAEIAQDYKPRPEVYLAAARAFGLGPEQVVMVAAHNRDLAAARAAGLGTAFFARPTEYGPGQDRDLKPEEDWDLVARDLADLAGQVARRS